MRKLKKLAKEKAKKALAKATPIINDYASKIPGGDYVAGMLKTQTQIGELPKLEGAKMAEINHVFTSFSQSDSNKDKVLDRQEFAQRKSLSQKCADQDALFSQTD